MSDDIRFRYLSDREAKRLYRDHPQVKSSPDDYCPTCVGEREYLWRGERVECDCELQLQLHKHYLTSGIGVNYQRLSWDDFEGDPAIKTMMDKYLARHGAYVSKGIGLLLHGEVGTGKCAVLGTEANMADGTYRAVEDLEVGDKVLGGTVGASEPNGVKSVYRVVTNRGHQFEVTGNHPVWVQGKDWVRADELSPGDLLEVASGWEPDSPERGHPDELYRFLGYLIADGGLSQSFVTWTKGNPKLIEDFKNCCDVLGFSVTERPEKGDCTTFCVHGVTKEWREKYLGVYRTLSTQKTVPDFVLRSSNRQAAEFVSAYFEGDGHYDATRKNTEFYSTSRALLVGVQRLMYRMGAPTSLVQKNGTYKDEPHVSWRLYVSSAGRTVMSGWSYRDEKNRPAPAFVEPSNVADGLCHCGCGAPTRVSQKTNSSAGHVKGDPVRYLPGHHIARRNAEVAEANSSVCCVESVEYVGEKATWAIQVDPTRHLYLGDILTHNTFGVTMLLKDLIKQGYKCYSTTFASMIEMFTAGWKSTADQRYFQEKIVFSDVLLLDDLGRELRTKNRLSESTFDDVLRRRVQDGRPTFITTNMTLVEMNEGYGAAVLSLLSEKSILHQVTGDDFRPKANRRMVREVQDGESRPIF